MDTFIISTVTFLVGAVAGWIVRDRSLAKKALTSLEREFNHITSSLDDKFDKLRDEVAARIKS